MACAPTRQRSSGDSGPPSSDLARRSFWNQIASPALGASPRIKSEQRQNTALQESSSSEPFQLRLSTVRARQLESAEGATARCRGPVMCSAHGQDPIGSGILGPITGETNRVSSSRRYGEVNLRLLQGNDPSIRLVESDRRSCRRLSSPGVSHPRKKPFARARKTFGPAGVRRVASAGGTASGSRHTPMGKVRKWERRACEENPPGQSALSAVGGIWGIPFWLGLIDDGPWTICPCS